MSVERRLTELAATYALPSAAPPALRRFLELVRSDPLAPTTLREPDVAVDAHIADALVALELDAVRSAGRIADIGSGAGVPGLILAAALPAAAVTLVEANRRKAAFLVAAAEAMAQANVTVVAERAESWPAGTGAHDLVTARALAPLAVLAEYAAPLLALRGALVAWKGRRNPGEERDGAAAANALGLEVAGVRPVRPWSGAEHLHLHLYVKVGPTPDRYPRRPGMASKRPLRG